MIFNFQFKWDGQYSLTNLSTESKRGADGFEAGASWPPKANK